MSTEELDDLDYYEIALEQPVTATEETVVEHKVAPDEVGERLDKVLVALRPELSRAHIQRLIEDEKLTVNGKPSKSGYKLRQGDNLRLVIPPPEPLAHLAP